MEEESKETQQCNRNKFRWSLIVAAAALATAVIVRIQI
jgi:hypothetical protein